MFHDISRKNTNVLVGLTVFILIFFEMNFLSSSHFLFTVNISAGFIVGFYMCCGKKIIPGLLLAIIIARYVGGIVYKDFTALTSIPHTLIYTFFVSSLAYGIDCFNRRLDSSTPDTFKRGISYIIIVAVMVVLASAIPALFHTFLNQTDFITEWKLFIKPTATGVYIFTSLIIFSSQYDSFLTDYKDKVIPYLVFLLLFFIFTYLIFQSTIQSKELFYIAPIMLILFMVHAFIYNFRLLIINSIAYVSFYSIALMNHQPPHIDDLIASFNTLLLSIIAVTVFSKILILKMKSNSEDLKDSQKRIESMMESVFDLFKASDFIEKADESYLENYLNNIFTIAFQLFPKIDSGICVKTKHNDVRVVNTIGYDKAHTKEWDIKKSSIIWGYDYSIHTIEANQFYQRILGTQYTEHIDLFPVIKDSIRFVIPLGNDEYGGITLEINQESKHVFTKIDIDNINYLQKMLNSFYDKTQLSLKNTNLKDDIVLSLIRTLELYDQYTGGHSEDVADLGKMLAIKLGLEENEVYNIYWAGIVHDIGKIGVDHTIINKESKLTLEEYEAVKQHALYGYSILNRSEDLTDIALLVKHHHEWWNGQGYPDKLKEDEIPQGAQILQVADSLSSMATKRSYSSVKSLEEIKKELILYSGTQFSPVIARAMIELIDQGTIKDYYKKRTSL